VNCDEIDEDRPRLSVNRNSCRLSRISWALSQIFCFRFDIVVCLSLCLSDGMVQWSLCVIHRLLCTRHRHPLLRHDDVIRPLRAHWSAELPGYTHSRV